MKKVSGDPTYSTVGAMISSSSHVLQRSNPQGNVLNILQELAIIVLSNLSLLMSPLSIAEQCIKGVHGLFREQKLSERLFLCGQWCDQIF